MNLGKSIEKTFPTIVYFLLLTSVFCAIFAVFFPIILAKLFLFIALCINITIALLVSNPKKVKFTISILSTSFLFYFLLAISFRGIRNHFPNPKSDGEVMGFAQYFHYPVYFDLFLFILITMIPFISYLLVSRLKK